MRSAAMVAAALGACAALAGCSAPSAEAPSVRVSEAVQAVPDRALDAALPTADEIADVLGVSGFMGQLVEGGPDMLLQGVRAAEATPLDCVSAGYGLQKVVYEAGPVRSVASQSWAGGDAAGPSATGFFGVVQFGDPAAAQAFFATSADRWHRCNGQTLVVNQPDRGTQGTSRITDVSVDDRIVSAVVMHDSGSTIQRALGIAGDCIVDVEISRLAGSDAGAVGDVAAVAQLMLRKVGAR